MKFMMNTPVKKFSCELGYNVSFSKQITLAGLPQQLGLYILPPVGTLGTDGGEADYVYQFRYRRPEHSPIKTPLLGNVFIEYRGYGQ